MKKQLLLFTLITSSLIMFVGCKKDGKTSISKYDTNTAYKAETKTLVEKLSPEKKSMRESKIKELENGLIYKVLVDSSKVESEYLPLLSAISYSIQRSYIENGKELFVLPNALAENIEKSKNGSEKMNFVITCSFLALNSNGGFPDEIVDVIERYRKKYGFFETTQTTFYDVNNKETSKTEPYNMVYLLSKLKPFDKDVLNAIYEVNFSPMGEWSENSEFAYLNTYMIEKRSYINFLKENYTSSDYLPKMKGNFWNDFDPIVRQRIEMLIFNRDCVGLQEEFNAAAENSERFHNAGKSSSKHLDLMDFVDTQLKKLDCYDKK